MIARGTAVDLITAPVTPVVPMLALEPFHAPATATILEMAPHALVLFSHGLLASVLEADFLSFFSSSSSSKPLTTAQMGEMIVP